MREVRSHKLPVVALAMLASCVLAACGGSSPSGSAASQQTSDEAKAVKFAQCLREHGLQASASKGGGGGAPLTLSATGPDDAGGEGGSGKVEAAMKACARYRPNEQGPKLSPAERAQRVDQLYKFARCMREHGIELETHVSNSGGAVGISIKRALNPQSPGFQNASKACQSLMPLKGPRARAPGAGGSGSGSVQTFGG